MSKLHGIFSICLGLVASLPVHAADWPTDVREISFLSQADQTEQPAMFYAPEGGNEPRPLLVALHTWSHDHRQAWSIRYAEHARKEGWVFVHPAFRGPNNRPEATGSALAIADVLSAVDYARSQATVDPSRIYLVGFSSGGMLGLRLAAERPDLWAGLSIWGPVVDLCRWHEETGARGFSKYHRDLERSLGGNPTTSVAAAEQCKDRSPLTHLRKAKGVNLDLNVGIRDGHGGYDIVPVGHTLSAYNLLARPEHRLSPEQIEFFQEQAALPAGLEAPTSQPAAFAGVRVLHRRASDAVRVTVFDGGHKIVYAAALEWLGEQARP